VLALFFATRGPTSDAASIVLPTLLSLAVAFDGLLLALHLCLSVAPLLKATWTRERARRLIAWSTFHHLGTVGVMLMLGTLGMENPWVALAIATAAACIGLAHAGLCRGAIHEIERARRTEREPSREATGEGARRLAARAGP
jgi:hypothetical protein